MAEPRDDWGLGYLLGLSPPWRSRQDRLELEFSTYRRWLTTHPLVSPFLPCLLALGFPEPSLQTQVRGALILASELKEQVLVTPSCLTLCDPIDCSPLGSSVHGILQVRILEWVAIPLDCKEIQPVHPEGDQSWVFTGRTDAEAESPILWPPHAKS